MTNMVSFGIQRQVVIEAFQFGHPEFRKFCVFLDSSRRAHHGGDGEDVTIAGPAPVFGLSAGAVYGAVPVLLRAG